MDNAKELVESMKATARKHAKPPLGPPPSVCYRQLDSGLRLCLTIDILTEDWIHQVGQLLGVSIPSGVSPGARFWHLSITRLGAGTPTPAEVDFWRRAFFDEPPLIETGGVLPGVHSRHYFWPVKN